MDYYHKLLLTGIISTGIMVWHLMAYHWHGNIWRRHNEG